MVDLLGCDQLIYQGVDPGVQAVVAQYAKKISQGSVRGGLLVGVNGCLKKGLSRHGVEPVALPDLGGGENRIMIKQQVRPLESHGIELGKIPGQSAVFPGKGLLPSKPDMGIGCGHSITSR